jgi:hypothetical protein
MFRGLKTKMGQFSKMFDNNIINSQVELKIEDENNIIIEKEEKLTIHKRER